MSKALENASTASTKQHIVFRLLKKSLTVIAAFSALGLLSYLFSLLTKIHGKSLPESYFANGYPSILGLLDSELFMGFVFVVTIGIICYTLLLFWRLHEVAVHKAEAMSSAHTQIVFALSLCGLFIDKTWWVLAIIIAFGRWDVLANRLSSIISNGLKGDK
ncbi:MULTISPECIES: magnesium transporter [Shewanella]|uniref:Magnesium transporter n=1 Tax=Shewanella electrodiphila TaxID=934143 RepID=A0ABT0KMJ1_9GAMM|nr:MULTISPECIES: magnesium transporter [Shewanella]MCC4831900.1 magnesium transporter [Shewanella sp. 10N.7]MCL1044989.1 magnesium transporter [Shewanella electrodiphila]PMG78193.1 magnesium transporter [Shewanella sp. 10N.286.51.B7]